MLDYYIGHRECICCTVNSEVSLLKLYYMVFRLVSTATYVMVKVNFLLFYYYSRVVGH